MTAFKLMVAQQSKKGPNLNLNLYSLNIWFVLSGRAYLRNLVRVSDNRAETKAPLIFGLCIITSQPLASYVLSKLSTLQAKLTWRDVGSLHQIRVVRWSFCIGCVHSWKKGGTKKPGSWSIFGQNSENISEFEKYTKIRKVIWKIRQALGETP